MGWCAGAYGEGWCDACRVWAGDIDGRGGGEGGEGGEEKRFCIHVDRGLGWILAGFGRVVDLDAFSWFFLLFQVAVE